ncbi:MAG: hypothetical protein Q7R70_01150 [Candidatus Diapherotrites archaeon]|nr:hypothetical protein [Candidatus Diapherotrites archaeon]
MKLGFLHELWKRILQAKIQFLASIILGLISVALGIIAWTAFGSDEFARLNLLAIVAIIGLIGLLVPVWVGFDLRKKGASFWYAAIVGATVSGVAGTLIGALNLLIIAPLAPAFSQPFGPSALAFGAFSTGFGFEGFLIGRTVASIAGALLALLGALLSNFSKK